MNRQATLQQEANTIRTTLGAVLDLFAHTVHLLQDRVAPLVLILYEGARPDLDLRPPADELSTGRVGHMRAFVANLAAKGGPR